MTAVVDEWPGLLTGSALGAELDLVVALLGAADDANQGHLAQPNSQR